MPLAPEDLAAHRLVLPLMPGIAPGPQVEVQGGQAYLRFGAWCSEAESWTAIVCEERVLAQHGYFQAESVSRRRQGTVGEPFVLPGGRMVRLRGAGVVVMDAPASSRLELVHLDDADVLYVRESAVVAFSGGLHWENGSIPGQGASPAMVQLAGQGAVLLVSRDVHCIPVRPQAPLVVRRSALVGWMSAVVVSPHTTLDGPFVLCEGEGTALIEARSSALSIERQG
ncbi:MAG: AIM24 family protein [Deltaproteobacteria bacterium]|nr:AIM24 family protein [Deltaproteobacteria bacterium]